MKTTNQLKDFVGQNIILRGTVETIRKQGKVIFLDISDRKGTVQAVAFDKSVVDSMANLKQESVIELTALVSARPEKNTVAGVENGNIELHIQAIKPLCQVIEVPFDKNTKVNIDTNADHMPFTLRSKRNVAVFKIQAEIVRSFRDFLNSQDFVEFQSPKLIGEDAEGGANSFDVEYFGHTAHLAQSPQLYKQIMVGVFERVFAVGNVYRAEKHATSRHLNEYTSMDIEFGFIESHEDIMAMENKILAYIVSSIKSNCSKEVEILAAELPDVPEKIPSLTLAEAQVIINSAYNVNCIGEPDLEPQHERWLCEYSKKEFNSDFIFITHFPISKRPFYTMEDDQNPGYAKGFDLLFRGVEITTGAQRIHDYDTLVSSMIKKGLNPEKFSFYLQAFKAGIPPHGGFGLGLERLTAKFLGIDNVKEATLFPRDINRIDVLLSK